MTIRRIPPLLFTALVLVGLAASCGGTAPSTDAVESSFSQALMTRGELDSRPPVNCVSESDRHFSCVVYAASLQSTVSCDSGDCIYSVDWPGQECPEVDPGGYDFCTPRPDQKMNGTFAVPDS